MAAQPGMIQFQLDALTSSGCETLSFPEAGVTCIVGGNNVGKSRLLRDINAFLENDRAAVVTFSDLQTLKPSVDAEIAEAFFSVGATEANQPVSQLQQYLPISNGGTALTVEAFVANYNSLGPGLRSAKSFFVWHASAGSLVNAASAGIGHSGMQGTNQPLALVFRDGTIEKALSDLAQESFGLPLTLDRLNMDVRLRVGKVAVPVPALDAPTREYTDAVRELPSLEEQGDGIKSFMGLVLNVLCGTPCVLLIDEPESFLHPAQARALGRWLGKAAVERQLQVIVSTHDRDFVVGLLDSGQDSVVNIVRITREGSENHFHELAHQDVAGAWGDPVLRYSNVLQGLFHKRVVITESDADCRFYGAVVDVLGAQTSRQAVSSDLLFVPSGGKQRVASMAQSLSRLGVDVFAILDFDALRAKVDVLNAVTALGGQWTGEMQDDYVALAEPANQRHLWDSLKHQGISGLPAGAAYQAGERLLSSLEARRVLVVPVGEMEDFDKSSNLHGAAWVSEMLEARKHETNEAVRKLCEPLLV